MALYKKKKKIVTCLSTQNGVPVFQFHKTIGFSKVHPYFNKIVKVSMISCDLMGI